MVRQEKKSENEVIWMACVVTNKKGEILLLKRAPSKKLFPNKWAVVGAGPLTGSENMREIALRELKDELGTEGEILEEGEVMQVQQDDINARVFPFHARISTNKVVLNEEHTEYAWVKEEDAEDYDLATGMNLIINEMLP